jgi:hypothetical protein
MNTNNLWGTLPGTDEIKPPIKILREQATVLGDLTNNVLEGRVRTITEGEHIVNLLDIVAPALQGYTFTVLEIKHGIEFYPLWYKSIVTNGGPASYKECSNEEAFLANLKAILSSHEIRKVIASLMAQSKVQ